LLRLFFLLPRFKLDFGLTFLPQISRSGCPGQSEARKPIKELPKHHKKLMFFCLF
jgi:hypothetical protein